MPKFVLRIGFQEFAVPAGEGAATLMKLLSDAIPVRSDFEGKSLLLEWADEGEEHMLAHSTMVSMKRIPPGTVFKRKRKDGRVEILRPIPIADKGAAQKPAAKAIRNSNVLELQFGT